MTTFEQIVEALVLRAKGAYEVFAAKAFTGKGILITAVVAFILGAVLF